MNEIFSVGQKILHRNRVYKSITNFFIFLLEGDGGLAMKIIAVDEIIHRALIGPDRIGSVCGFFGLFLYVPPPLARGKPRDIDMGGHRVKPRVGFSEDVGFLRPRAVIGNVMGDKNRIFFTERNKHRVVGNFRIYKAPMHPDVIRFFTNSSGQDGMGKIAPFHKSFAVKYRNVFFNTPRMSDFPVPINITILPPTRLVDDKFFGG